MEDSLSHQSNDQVALATGTVGDEFRQFQVAHHVQHGLDMTVRQRTRDPKSVVDGNEFLPFEYSADELNLVQGQMGEIGHGSIPDLPVLAVTFAEQVGRRRVPVGDLGHVHVDIICIHIYYSSTISINYMTTFCTSKTTEVPAGQALPLYHGPELRVKEIRFLIIRDFSVS